jgi:acylphosphatase
MPYEVILSGRVQGVGCRWYCSHVAQKMGLRGAATNLDDGTVSVLLATEDERTAYECMVALRDNTFRLSFYGRITAADLSKNDLTVEGDYVW